MSTIPSHVPKCPNHGSPLEGVGFPIPRKGKGKCPVSGAEFEFEAESDSSVLVKDKFGNLVPKVGWSVSGNE